MIKRRIDVRQIQGIIISRYSNRFIIHVPEQYDYYIELNKYRTQVIEAIVEAHLKQTGRPTFNIYLVDNQDLT